MIKCELEKEKERERECVSLVERKRVSCTSHPITYTSKVKEKA
jgi:hypothetical protein